MQLIQKTTYNAPSQIVVSDLPDFTALIDAFLREKDGHLAESRSKAVYRNELKLFFAWLSDKGIWQPQRQHIVKYKESLQLRSPKLSASTISNYLVPIRLLFEWTDAKGIYPNIAARIKGARAKGGMKKSALSKGQVARLLERVATIDESEYNTDRHRAIKRLTALRDLAMMKLAFTTGVRVIEISRARKCDLRTEVLTDEDGSEIEVILLSLWRKGHSERDETVVVPKDTLAAIKRYLTERAAEFGAIGEEDALFASLSNRNSESIAADGISRIFKARLRQIGLDERKFTAHSSRHTFALNYLMSGGTLADVQRSLSHKNIATTQVYLESMDKLSQIIRIAKKIG